MSSVQGVWGCQPHARRCARVGITAWKGICRACLEAHCWLHVAPTHELEMRPPCDGTVSLSLGMSQMKRREGAGGYLSVIPRRAFTASGATSSERLWPQAQSVCDPGGHAVVACAWPH